MMHGRHDLKYLKVVVSYLNTMLRCCLKFQLGQVAKQLDHGALK